MNQSESNLSLLKVPYLVDNEIEIKTITQLLGMNFYIPEYQRGYRWTSHHVEQLLDDIWHYRNNGDKNTFYCLQPIVVKRALWNDLEGNEISGYELIDGQQRLTTIHRIITYLIHTMGNSLQQEGYEQELYSIYYKTRLESKLFLESNQYNQTTPDLYYMSEAYETIKNWFERGDKGTPRHLRDSMLYTLLSSIVYDTEGEVKEPDHSVKVIWYEVNEVKIKESGRNSKELFTRLNRGKIPLTSAELIKAKLVSNHSFSKRPMDEQIRRKTEIIQIWEEIEAGLNDSKFWAFISNQPKSDYSNKIELLFDILTKKQVTEPDPLYSFIKLFKDITTEEKYWKKWIEVEELYRTLRFWFTDKNLYHKVGFLIAMGTSPLTLFKLKRKNSKGTFEAELDKLIANEIPADWDSLRYDSKGDYSKISKVLLLHNLEIIRKNKSLNEFFPFEAFKAITNSLEHIHAQNTEEMDPNKKEPLLEWLQEHISILKERKGSDPDLPALIEEVEASYNNLRYQTFKTLSSKVLEYFHSSEGNDENFMHRIENLTLMGLSGNIILGNSAFELKRRKITRMDKQGEFIPIVTKRIFLKYYSDPSDPNYTLWTAYDREQYLKDIETHMNHYLFKTKSSTSN